MKIINASVPAKVILSGDHAVVYGKPGLVSAINLRLKFSVWESKNKITDKAVNNIIDVVKKFLAKEKIEFTDKSFGYHIESEIPIGRGLGSSAAFAVATTAALLKYYSDQKFSKEIINNLAYSGEKYFHKNPSGVDVSASCFGGLIFYRKEFEFLKQISSLNFKIPKRIEDNLYLIDSGQPYESTAEMVASVGKQYNTKTLLTEEILNDIEKTTKRMTVSLIKDDVEFFKKCLIDNEVYLEMLGVVSKNTKKLFGDLSSFGVGKITGAGGLKTGSGFILFYGERKKELEGFLKKNRLNYYRFQQDFQGLI